MCLENLIQKYDDLKDCKEHSFRFEDTDLTYFLYDKRVEKTKEKCAQYYIIDFKSSKMKSWLTYFNNTDNATRLQSRLLMERFFDYKTDLRFNLYLLFIVDDLTECEGLISIQTNLNYGKKLVFTEEKFISFIRYSHYKRFLAPNYNYSYFSMQLDSMVQNSHLNYALSLFKEQIEKDDILYDIKWQLNTKFLMNQTYLTGLKSYESDTEHGQNNYKYLKKLRLCQFRMFGDERVIPFSQVNLFVGDNGAGKTSILEAIEYALTSRIHKYDDFGAQPEKGTVKLEVSRSKSKKRVFSSDKNEAKDLLNKWYGFSDRSLTSLTSEGEDATVLLNKFFNKYNYFDTRGAYRFALSNQIDNNDEIDIVNLLTLNEAYTYNIKELKELKDGYSAEFRKLNSDLAQIRILEKEIPSNNIDAIDIELSDDILFEIWSEDKKGFEQLLHTQNIDKQRRIISIIIGRLEKKKTDLSQLINILKSMKFPDNEFDAMVSSLINEVEKYFILLNSTKDYNAFVLNNRRLYATKTLNSESKVSISQMSIGQRVCLALAMMFALYKSSSNIPKFIILDEPMANLDNLHILNLLDILRDFALNGTQIFFTTSDQKIAKLFRRKFSFFRNDFSVFRINNDSIKVDIELEKYDHEHEEVLSSVGI